MPTPVELPRPVKPRRSALYLPASNSRAIDKARSLPCDVVILDLEDAVSPDSKEVARKQALDAIRSGDFGRREVAVRVNSLETHWGREDLQLIAQVRPDAILLPKVNSASDIRAAHAFLEADTDVELWAMAETAQGFLNLREIGATSRDSPLTCLVVGTNDLALELGATLDATRTTVLSHLSAAVLTARAYGLSILDGVFNQIENDAAFELQCRQGRDFGFDGKTLIHPRQIQPCNTIFTPDSAELDWARRVIDAFEEPANASRGVLKLDGKMVERLHLVQARRILSAAGAAADTPDSQS
jgi:citrate lyase subunit beta / citryl-CoA lyase